MLRRNTNLPEFTRPNRRRCVSKHVLDAWQILCFGTRLNGRSCGKSMKRGKLAAGLVDQVTVYPIAEQEWHSILSAYCHNASIRHRARMLRCVSPPNQRCILCSEAGNCANYNQKRLGMNPLVAL